MVSQVKKASMKQEKDTESPSLHLQRQQLLLRMEYEYAMYYVGFVGFRLPPDEVTITRSISWYWK